MKTLTELRAAKTSALVAYYNANSGKSPITKFVDRATAEARCVNLFEELAAKAPKPLMTMSLAETEAFAKALQAKKAQPKSSRIVITESTDAKNARLAKEERAGSEACDAAEVTDNFASVTEQEHAEHRGEAVVVKRIAKASPGIKASWDDPDVRLARSTRDQVSANGTVYPSLRAAFVALGLSLSKHIKFRTVLKAARKASFSGVEFVVVEL